MAAGSGINIKGAHARLAVGEETEQRLLKTLKRNQDQEEVARLKTALEACEGERGNRR